MNNLKLSWFSNTVKSSLIAAKDYKYTPHIVTTSIIASVILYIKKPIFAKIFLNAIPMMIMSPIFGLMYGGFVGSYHYYTRDLWFRLQRAWTEIQIGAEIPD